MTVKKKRIIYAVVAAVVIGAAAVGSMTLDHNADIIDVGTENDITIGVVTDMPAGLTLFSDGAGTLPPLWKVTRGEDVLYMLGSMHTVPAECFPLDSRVKNAYEASTAVAVEHKNLDAADFLTSRSSSYDTSGLCAPGDELKNHLTERQYELVRETAQASGFDLETLDKMLPWKVYDCLTEIIGSENNGSQAVTYGIDTLFQIQANIDSKPKFNIESDQSRVELFPAMPEDVAAISIERELTRNNYDAVYQAWKTGDLDLLYNTQYVANDLTGEQAAAFEHSVKYLLTDRNYAMAGRAMEFLDGDETVFYIAGAGHFCGEEGIPELLKNKGCTVERIK